MGRELVLREGALFLLDFRDLEMISLKGPFKLLPYSPYGG
jgi:hypothetical protein